MAEAEPEIQHVVCVEAKGRLVLVLASAAYRPGKLDLLWLATRGRGDVAIGFGDFSPPPGKDPRAALEACAGIVGKGALPERERVAAILRTLDGLVGEHAACVARFKAACGPCTLPIVAAGGDPNALRLLYQAYGRDRVDAVLGRMPILSAVVIPPGRHEISQPPYLAACAAIMGEADLPLDRLAEHVVGCLNSRQVFERYGPVHIQPETPDEHRQRTRNLARFLKNLDGQAASPGHTVQAMLLCGEVPIDWMPRDPDGVTAMACVLGAAVQLRKRSLDALDVRTLVAPVRGDWAKAWRGLSRHARLDGLSPHVWADGVSDMPEAYAAEVLRPALAYARARTGLGTRARENGYRSKERAWTTLFGGKGIQAVAEASADWHRRGPEMTAEIGSLSGLHGARFPRPFPDFLASNGLRVVPITSGAELVAEGAAMGHCVGSQGSGCRTGAYAIASVRSPEGARLSTVKIARSGKVSEHRARFNADPDEPDLLAVRELVARNRGLPPPPRGLEGKAWRARLRERIASAGAPDWTTEHPYDPSDPVRILRAASYWDRYVPKASRGSLQAIVRGLSPKVADALPPGTPAKLTVPFSQTLLTAARVTVVLHHGRALLAVCILSAAFIGFQFWRATSLGAEATAAIPGIEAPPAQPDDPVKPPGPGQRMPARLPHE